MENTTISSPTTFNPNSFDLTDSALDHFKNSLKTRRSGRGIRFEVLESSGCTGYTYSMDFVDEETKDDLIFDSVSYTHLTLPTKRIV